MVQSIINPSSFLKHLQALPKTDHYCIAYSGGLDSHVLLSLMVELRSQIISRISVFHINHGIYNDADEWQQHCQSVCREFGLELLVKQINASEPEGQSPEAWARQLRYEAFSSLMEKNDILLTAHHRDDQAETLLLQLLRGAGPSGLSAMPACKTFANGFHARPLLGFSREEIHEYAIQKQLQWIEDHSNQDEKYDRNYMRHQLMPVLKKRWPSLAKTLSRAASHQASAMKLMEKLAEQDFSLVKCKDKSCLKVEPLLNMDDLQVKNVIRYWLDMNDVLQPNTKLIQQIHDDLVKGREDSEACVSWSDLELRQYQKIIYLIKKDSQTESLKPVIWNMTKSLPVGDKQLVARKVSGKGLSVSKLENKQVKVAFRQGGEKIKPSGKQHTRELKKLFQENEVLPWQRDQVPLLFVDNELVVVPGICIAEGYQAENNMPGLEIFLEGTE